MNYLNYMNDFKEKALEPLHSLTVLTNSFLNPLASEQTFTWQRLLRASSNLIERETRKYEKPSFGIDQVMCDNSLYKVEEQTIMSKPFCHLINFKKIGYKKHQENVLVAAPFSGHYATLLRDTVRTLLQDHNVYITDWVNASEVALNEGEFNLESYIDYTLDFIRYFKGDCHVLAVCQPAVPVLISSSLLAQYDEPSQPKSMTLMGGPIDTRINPGQVNEFSTSHSMDWFKDNLISRVSVEKKGAGRLVCPGFLLLGGFVSLNFLRHEEAVKTYFDNLVKGDLESTNYHERFYDEYNSVMDLPAQYYLDSINVAFKRHDLPKGSYKWRGILVNPSAIKHTGLLTVEGEHDDISCAGQTYAAHKLCPNIPAKRKESHLQKGVGHYGIFSGKRWRTEIYPVIKSFIEKCS